MIDINRRKQTTNNKEKYLLLIIRRRHVDVHNRREKRNRGIFLK